MAAPRLAALAATLALAECADVGPSWTDPTPQARIEAIQRDAHDPAGRHDLPRLVESLAADDAAVRMAAQHALQRITGSDLGYRFDDGPEARAAALARWQAWLQAYGSMR
jgi:hypothetical protein